MKTREQQKEQRREAILRAGLDLFVSKGYPAAKTSEIAAAVGMSDGLLFHYFPSKEKLYEELIRTGMEASEVWMAGSTAEPLAFFMEVTEQILDMIRESPQDAKFFILMAQALRSPATPAGVLRLLAAQEVRFDKTVELIRAGQQAGTIRIGDPQALAWAFWCSIQGIAEQLALYPQTPFPQAGWVVAILKTGGM